MKTSIPSFMVLFTALEPRTTDSPTRGNFTVTFSYSHLRDVQFLIVCIACLRSRKRNASLPMERDSSPSPTGIASCGCVTVILPWYLLCWLVIWDCSAMDEESKCFFYPCPLLLYFLLESNIMYEYLGRYFIYFFWLICCFIAP